MDLSSFGVSDTSLEEVFLKVTADGEAANSSMAKDCFAGKLHPSGPDSHTNRPPVRRIPQPTPHGLDVRPAVYRHQALLKSTELLKKALLLFLPGSRSDRHGGEPGREQHSPDPFRWDFVGKKLVFMAVEGPAYFALNIPIQYCFFLDYWLSDLKGPIEPDEDDDVTQERERLYTGRSKNDILQMKDLCKTYMGQTRPAVDRICLGEPAGECFGLLGVNGAGKTTTFKMLTGDTDVSSGDASVAGYRCWIVPRHLNVPLTLIASRVQSTSHSPMLSRAQRRGKATVRPVTLEMEFHRKRQGVDPCRGFGDGYVVTTKIRAGRAGASLDLRPAEVFMESSFPGCLQREKHDSTLQYEVPASSMTRIFQLGLTNKEKLNTEDYSVSKATLDQVFIKFAKQQQSGVENKLVLHPRAAGGRRETKITPVKGKTS